MQVQVEITSQPIDPRSALPAELVGSAGAVAEFLGLVRDVEDGRSIAALEYEAYSPMAEQEMRRILENLAGQHPCLFARVIHRVGVVPVGETAIHVSIAARHRAEAFAMLAGFMDRLKLDVPIWKRRALALNEMAAPTKQP
jgi:molybdopterin synthase catalytic subunit